MLSDNHTKLCITITYKIFKPHKSTSTRMLYEAPRLLNMTTISALSQWTAVEFTIISRICFDNFGKNELQNCKGGRWFTSKTSLMKSCTKRNFSPSFSFRGVDTSSLSCQEN